MKAESSRWWVLAIGYIALGLFCGWATQPMPPPVNSFIRLPGIPYQFWRDNPKLWGKPECQSDGSGNLVCPNTFPLDGATVQFPQEQPKAGQIPIVDTVNGVSYIRWVYRADCHYKPKTHRSELVCKWDTEK